MAKAGVLRRLWNLVRGVFGLQEKRSPEQQREYAAEKSIAELETERQALLGRLKQLRELLREADMEDARVMTAKMYNELSSVRPTKDQAYVAELRVRASRMNTDWESIKRSIPEGPGRTIEEQIESLDARIPKFYASLKDTIELLNVISQIK